jgi:glycosyltransferase involved in cell wall biosynthesis
MKICILHNSSPGGARRLVDEVALRLVETDDVTVCTWGDEPTTAPPDVESLWCPAPPLRLPPPLHPFGDLARSYLGSARAAREVNRRRFDVALVLACRWGQAPEGLRHLRIPHLYFAQEGRRRTMETGYRSAAKETDWRRLPRYVGTELYDAIGSYLDRRAITASAAVVTNSDHTSSQLASAYGVVARTVELGVDLSRFRPAAVGRRDRRVLLVGALDPTKGGELAIRSLARISSSLRPSLRLISNRGDAAYGDRLDSGSG